MAARYANHHTDSQAKTTWTLWEFPLTLWSCDFHWIQREPNEYFSDRAEITILSSYSVKGDYDDEISPTFILLHSHVTLLRLTLENSQKKHVIGFVLHCCGLCDLANQFFHEASGSRSSPWPELAWTPGTNRHLKLRWPILSISFSWVCLFL